MSNSITSDGCSTLSYQITKPMRRGYVAPEGAAGKPEYYVDLKGDSRLPHCALPQDANGPSCSSVPPFELTIIGNDPGRSNCVTSVSKTFACRNGKDTNSLLCLKPHGLLSLRRCAAVLADLVAFGDLGKPDQFAMSTRQWRDEARFNNTRHIKMKVRVWVARVGGVGATAGRWVNGTGRNLQSRGITPRKQLLCRPPTTHCTHCRICATR